MAAAENDGYAASDWETDQANLSLTVHPAWPAVTEHAHSHLTELTCRVRIPAYVADVFTKVHLWLEKVSLQQNTSKTHVRAVVPNEEGTNLSFPCLHLPGCGASVTIALDTRTGDHLVHLRMRIPRFRPEVSGPWSCASKYSTDLGTTTIWRTRIIVGCTSSPSQVQLVVEPSKYQHGGMILEETEVTLSCKGNTGCPHYRFEILLYTFTGDAEDETISLKTRIVPNETVYPSMFEDKACEWQGLAKASFRFTRGMPDLMVMCAVFDARVQADSLRIPATSTEFFVARLDEIDRWREDVRETLSPPPVTVSVLGCKDDLWTMFGVSATGVLIAVATVESIYLMCRSTMSASKPDSTDDAAQTPEKKKMTKKRKMTRKVTRSGVVGRKSTTSVSKPSRR